jgi:alanine racemase
MSKRVTLEIDLERLRGNFREIADRVAPCQVMAVLKANAYGLGVRPIAEALVGAGAARIGVAELHEAMELQDIGVPVQILGGILPDEIPEAVAHDIILPITDLETAKRISRNSAVQNKTAKCHSLIDTGMGRLGIVTEQALETILEAKKLPNLMLEGIYTHFPQAYTAGIDYSRSQIDQFRNLLSALKEKGVSFNLIHTANSDAVNNLPEALTPPFNLVRTGLNLYGVFDTEGERSVEVEPVLTLKARLTAVRQLRAGTTLGYERTFTLARDTRVGTIAAGYADGLPLALSNCGSILVDGVRCPILGRVSMDYTTIDLSHAPNATVGDTVLCLGGEGSKAIRVEDWARLKGTHSYDIICSIGSRVERVCR